jgi:hypothetical protein
MRRPRSRNRIYQRGFRRRARLNPPPNLRLKYRQEGRLRCRAPSRANAGADVSSEAFEISKFIVGSFTTAINAYDGARRKVPVIAPPRNT